MNRTVRWSLLLTAACSIACISVPPPSGEYSIGEATADSWGVLRVIALALAPDSRLTAVFADSNFNIYVGAWQIEE